jgi:hypothetical protein
MLVRQLQALLLLVDQVKGFTVVGSLPKCMRGMGPCPSRMSHRFLPLRPAASRRLPCSADTSCCGVEPAKISAAIKGGCGGGAAAAAGAGDALYR